jgi:hypothetical protein
VRGKDERSAGACDGTQAFALTTSNHKRTGTRSITNRAPVAPDLIQGGDLGAAARCNFAA